jgi:hypothetical protein
LVVGAVLGSGVTAAVLSGDDSDEVAAAPSVDSQSASATPSANPTDPVAEPSPSDEFLFTDLAFGDAMPVETEDGAERTSITVERPTLARCQYASIGCTPPETGDRVVQVEVVINNTGDTVASWGSDYFVLEFRDGTQMLSSDGNAYEYGPSNTMDYSVKVRPGTTFRSTLVFEAPNGPFSILVLTSDFDGVPFAGWS